MLRADRGIGRCLLPDLLGGLLVGLLADPNMIEYVGLGKASSVSGTGAFQGVMIATTPTGSRMICALPPMTSRVSTGSPFAPSWP